MNARILIPLLLAVACGSAAAKEGSGGGSATPNPGIAQERRVEQDIGADAINPMQEAPAGLQIDGTVTDGSGSPLANVVVKLFSNGVVTASAQTAADGTFRIEANPPIGGNNTSVIWFQSPDPDRLLDTQAVLSEGATAKERHLFPPCVQHVQILGNQATVSVRLMTPDELKAAIQKSGCLGGSS